MEDVSALICLSVLGGDCPFVVYWDFCLLHGISHYLTGTVINYLHWKYKVRIFGLDTLTNAIKKFFFVYVKLSALVIFIIIFFLPYIFLHIILWLCQVESYESKSCYGQEV